MSNYNLRIALTKIKGAKVMDVEGKTCTKRCIVIPIDNEEGTVVDAYEANRDGVMTWKPLNDVFVNLSTFEFKEKRYGQSHGLKVQFSKRRLESMSEDELRAMPFIGNMKPWVTPNVEDDDDLPLADAKSDW